MTDSSLLLTIAVLGGTGKEGKGLAYRWAKAGYHVHIGSRSPEKAEVAAKEVLGLLEGEAYIEGMSNIDAVKKAHIIVIAVPYIAHKATLESVTVPLVPPKVATVQMPSAGSAAQEAQGILGKSVQVAAAFQNISHEHLLNDDYIDCDVLVTGTTKEVRAETLKLVEAAGLIGWDAGPLENSVVLEGLTSVLIGINKKYGSTHAGIKITGATHSL
jgi:8-hydroxy-5-deazaflavin:NADPH oxidoreductase